MNKITIFPIRRLFSLFNSLLLVTLGLLLLGLMFGEASAHRSGVPAFMQSPVAALSELPQKAALMAPAEAGNAGSAADSMRIQGLDTRQPLAPPVANDDTFTPTEDVALLIPEAAMLANDSDPDLDPLTAITDTNPAQGSLTAVSGVGWITATADGSSTVTEITALAEVGGRPAISYYDLSNTALKYAVWNGSQWVSQTVDNSANVGASSSLAVVGGQPAISYVDQSSFTLKYAAWNGSQWVLQTVDSSTGVANFYTSLAVVGGQPAISYFDGTNTALKYAAWNGSQWISQTVDNSADLGVYSSLVELNGQPAISYFDNTNSALKYAAWTGSQWVSQTVDNSASVGAFTSLAIVSGQPAISYLDATNFALKYAAWTGTDWISETVDSSSNTGLYTSLSTLQGEPIISYYDFSSGALRYAARSGGSWSLQTVDNSADVGRFTSLAIVNNQPAISYQDVSAGHLKYASLTADGYEYAPAADFCGSDSFQYRANDGVSSSNVATVTLSVTCVNDAPLVQNDVYTAFLNTPLVVSSAASGVLGNDSDVEGDSFTAVLDQNVANGTLTLNADGTFNYTPPPNFLGVVTFTYRATDTLDFSAVAVATISIKCPANPALSVAICIFIDGTDASLNWLNNVDATGGYEVHISQIPYFTPGAGTLTTTLPAGSEQYLHLGVIGNLTNYYYYVVPLNCTGCVTPTSNHVGKFGFAIVPGS